MPNTTHRSSSAIALAIVGALLAACSSPAFAQPRPHVAAVADASTTPAAITASASPCRIDADCGWEDPCTPMACVAAHPPTPGVNCARPSTPGDCRCVTGSCTTVRNELRRRRDAPVACSADATCAFDAARGVCRAALASEIAPASTGIQCACTAAQRCVEVWHGDVPCRSWRDCSVGPDGAAAPSWLVRRTHDRPVRPCRDDEHDATCRHGVCRVVSWRC